VTQGRVYVSPCCAAGEPGLNGTRGRRGRKGDAGVDGDKGQKGDSVYVDDFDWSAIVKNHSNCMLRSHFYARQHVVLSAY